MTWAPDDPLSEVLDKEISSSSTRSNPSETDARASGRIVVIAEL
jgi:hypothetical protein